MNVSVCQCIDMCLLGKESGQAKLSWSKEGVKGNEEEKKQKRGIKLQNREYFLWDNRRNFFSESKVA